MFSSGVSMRRWCSTFESRQRSSIEQAIWVRINFAHCSARGAHGECLVFDWRHEAGLQVGCQTLELKQIREPGGIGEEKQLAALAAPRILHLGHSAFVIQMKPAAALQLECPSAHRLRGIGAAFADDIHAGHVNAQHQLNALSIERQIAHFFFRDKIF